MLHRIKAFWKGYLASIPKPDEEKLEPDGRIIREDFPSEAHSQGTVDAYRRLAAILTEHLHSDDRDKAERRLLAKLKPGVDPEEALARWINQSFELKGVNWGAMQLDWKATEEVHWQATRLLKSHSIPITWEYNYKEDSRAARASTRGEIPTDSPLDSFAQALGKASYTLFRFSPYDGVFAFAVKNAESEVVSELLEILRIRHQK